MLKLLAARPFGPGDAVVEHTRTSDPEAVVRGVDREFLVSGGPESARASDESSGGPVEGEDVSALAEGEHQRGLRPVNHKTGGELLAARAQERRRSFPPLGRERGSSEKMVPTETSVSRLEEPSSGSRATTRGAPASARRRRELLRAQPATGARHKASIKMGVGDDVELGLEVAAALVVAQFGELAFKRAGSDQLGDVLAGGGERGDRRRHRRASYRPWPRSPGNRPSSNNSS